MRVPGSLNALMHDGLNAEEAMREILLNGQLKDVGVCLFAGGFDFFSPLVPLLFRGS